jgi:hypothetical protein
MGKNGFVKMRYVAPAIHVIESEPCSLLTTSAVTIDLNGSMVGNCDADRNIFTGG